MSFPSGKVNSDNSCSKKVKKAKCRQTASCKTKMRTHRHRLIRDMSGLPIEMKCLLKIYWVKFSPFLHAQLSPIIFDSVSQTNLRRLITNSHIFHFKDVLSFENFFKIWLLDSSTDQEHLRIILPSAFTQDSEGQLKRYIYRQFRTVLDSSYTKNLHCNVLLVFTNPFRRS